MIIHGTFEVRLNPLDFSQSGADGIQFGRLEIDKTFEGPLQARSRGEMLSARSPVQGSAGYVALEQVQGRLDGREGSFVLQHFGTMAGGDQRLVLEVLPDSATGELQGLRGKMTIRIVDGQHHYDFDYQLPEQPA